MTEEKERLEGSSGKQSGDQPEISAEERLGRAFKAGTEREKKECALIIDRCSDLAKKAKRQKDITPSLNFQAKLKTAEEIKRLRAEYEGFKKEAMLRAGKFIGEDGEKFKKIAEAHFRSLDSYFDLEDDFGFKPLKGDI